jgi:hypothetical protein
MLRLHYYSNIVGLRLESIEEEDGVYSLEEIKEFEDVSRAWKEALAEHLLQGIARPYHRTVQKLVVAYPLQQRIIPYSCNLVGRIREMSDGIVYQSHSSAVQCVFSSLTLRPYSYSSVAVPRAALLC